jgi:hypothetical protein
MTARRYGGHQTLVTTEVSTTIRSSMALRGALRRRQIRGNLENPGGASWSALAADPEKALGILLLLSLRNAVGLPRPEGAFDGVLPSLRQFVF